MPTRKEFGLLVALGLIVTVVVFPLGFFASRALWPTSSQSGEADPLRELNSKYKGFFKTRTEIFKTNWCQANQTRCPNGEFPTVGHEADVVKNYTFHYDELNLSSVDPRDESYRCTQIGPLSAEIKGDNDRCCQTNNSVIILRGCKNTVHGVSCCIPSFRNAYQFVFIGECHSNSSLGCSKANGQCCQQKQRPVSLLCLPKGKKSYVFGLFYVDAYCFCTCASV